MMSAWPACWVVSARMCVKTRRADHRAPGANHGASGSGWLESRSTVATRASVAAATASYSSSRLARVSPSTIRKPSAYAATSAGGLLQSTLAQSMSGCAAGPSWMKRAHSFSVLATCLIRPPRVSSLIVERVRACSSDRPWTVTRNSPRCLWSTSRRSARSPVRDCVGLSALVVMEAP